MVQADACLAAQLCSYLDKYTKAIIVHADNVGSNQLMMIRKARRQPGTGGADRSCAGATAGQPACFLLRCSLWAQRGASPAALRRQLRASRSVGAGLEGGLPANPRAASHAPFPLQGLRPESVVVMGKNTMMKRTIEEYVKRTGNTDWLVRPHSSPPLASLVLG